MRIAALLALTLFSGCTAAHEAPPCDGAEPYEGASEMHADGIVSEWADIACLTAGEDSWRIELSGCRFDFVGGGALEAAETCEMPGRTVDPVDGFMFVQATDDLGSQRLWVSVDGADGSRLSFDGARSSAGPDR